METNRMCHIGNGTYKCLNTLKLYRRTVGWEYGTLTTTWIPA